MSELISSSIYLDLTIQKIFFLTLKLESHISVCLCRGCRSRIKETSLPCALYCRICSQTTLHCTIDCSDSVWLLNSKEPAVMQRWLHPRHLRSICGRMGGRLDDGGRRCSGGAERAAVRDRSAATGRPEGVQGCSVGSAWPDDWMTAAGAAVVVVGKSARHNRCGWS